MPEYLEVQAGKFTFIVATDRLYSPAGVWVLERGNILRMGLSDFLQQRSGDIAFAAVTPEGTRLAVGDVIAAVETIKVNMNLESPAAGILRRPNPQMETGPEIINQDPYGEGWLCEVEASGWEADRKNMLDAAAYFEQMKREAESEGGPNG